VLFLPNGVDLDLFKPSAPDTQLLQELGIGDKKVILYAGTLGFAQGLEVALQAMQMLQTELPDLLLILIGSGSERTKLVDIARQEHLVNVKFLDPQPPEYIARLYTLAYAGFASLKKLPLFEGARPSKLFPVMAAGKPVIYSGAGEAARLVREDANAGIIVPPEEPQALAQALRELSNNPQLANQLGANGRRYVEQHLSWSQLVKSWLQQLQNRSPD
jgi:glycosyltransferase involved in cell wall biosynthesis